MTSRDLCYWLQGFFEISNAKQLDERQTEMIKKHLALVFVHEIDPSYGDKEEQAKLNNIHNKPETSLKDKWPMYDWKPGVVKDDSEENVVYRC
jgi:hypothetical protein